MTNLVVCALDGTVGAAAGAVFRKRCTALAVLSLLSKLSKFIAQPTKADKQPRESQGRLHSLLTLACLFLSRCEGVGSVEGNVRLTTEMVAMLNISHTALTSGSKNAFASFVPLTGHVARTLAWCLGDCAVRFVPFIFFCVAEVELLSS